MVATKTTQRDAGLRADAVAKERERLRVAVAQIPLYECRCSHAWAHTAHAKECLQGEGLRIVNAVLTIIGRE